MSGHLSTTVGNCYKTTFFSFTLCVYIPEEDESNVVLGIERLDVAVAPLEPSPSAVLTGAAEE